MVDNSGIRPYTPGRRKFTGEIATRVVFEVLNGSIEGIRLLRCVRI